MKAVVCLSFGLAWLAVACGPAPADSSVTYQINPAHTGAIEFPRGFDVPLREVWSRDLPRQISYPIIARGKVFVTTGDSRQTTDEKTLFALNLTTGETLWSKLIPGTTKWSATAYGHGRLFVVNFNGLLRAFDPDTGSELWASQLPGGVDAPPVARGEAVYVGSGNNLNAVNAVSGEVIWRQPVEYGDTSSPALSSDGVFVSYPCRVYQFDAVTGEARWTLRGPCHGGGGNTTVFYSDRLYVRNADVYDSAMVSVFEGSSGNRLGKIDKVVVVPAFRGGIGYFSGPRGVRAQSVRTGELLWQFTSTKRPALPPIVINGKVVVASSAGELAILDGTSGDILQTISLGKKIEMSNEGGASPLSGLGAGGGLLIVPATAKLFAFRGTTR